MKNNNWTMISKKEIEDLLASGNYKFINHDRRLNTNYHYEFSEKDGIVRIWVRESRKYYNIIQRV